MPPPEPYQRPITTAEVLREALVVFGRRWWRYLLVYSLPAWCAAAVVAVLDWPWGPALGLSLALLLPLASATVAHLVLADPDGRGPGFRAYVSIAPRIPVLVAAGLVHLIGIFVGFLLLVVPGLMLTAAWSVFIPVLVVERGVGVGLRRSAGLTDGYRWTGFWVAAIPTLVDIGLSVVQWGFDWHDDVAFWGSTTLTLLLGPYAAVAAALFYRRLADLPQYSG